MTHNWMLVPASADPVIAVLHQRIEKDLTGRTVLKGELLNESGQTVNIPHALVMFYNSGGQVIWVSDAYSYDRPPPEHRSRSPWPCAMIWRPTCTPIG